MFKASLLKGFQSAKSTAWTLVKYIFPITLFVSIIQHTPVFPWLMDVITPLMGYIGLRAEAAIPLVFGIGMNLYAAVGAILSLEWTVKEIFILATMLSFCHNMFVESAVAKSVGVKVWITVLLRVSLMIVSAVIINLTWNGGQEMAKMVGTAQEAVILNGWAEIIWFGVKSATSGVLVVLCVVFPVVIGVQLLKDYHLFEYVVKVTEPLTRLLNMNKKTSTTLTAGLLFGFIYGAGLMIQAVKDDKLSYRDVTLTFVFLCTAHAIIEDTLIFLPLGISVWPLLVIRVAVALVLTLVIATIWKEKKEVEDYGETNQNRAV